ncbi:hypothetical protein BGX29_009664 [Mortierella sp. GBA35]|nr:hypothetical protein BGX29_009664 [Mortierella sp. GBA35]
MTPLEETGKEQEENATAPPIPPPQTVDEDSDKPHRALLVPELVAHIFAFLSPYVVIHRASLVSRNWCAYSRRFCPLPPVVAVWSPYLTPSESRLFIEETLPNAKILHLVPGRATAIGLLAHDRENAAQNELLQNIQGITISNSSRIFRLVIEGRRPIQSRLDGLLGCSPSFARGLSEIVIDSLSNQSSLFIDAIFDSCPSLKALSLAERGLLADINTVVQATLTKDHALWTRTASDPPLSLLRLTIKSLLVSQDFLKAIISACPNLLALELSSIHLGTLEPSGPVLSPINRIPFFHHIAQHCPRLERIQVSYVGLTLDPRRSQNVPTAEEVMEFRNTFSSVRCWSFDRTDLSVSTLPHLLRTGLFRQPREDAQICLRGLEIHPEGRHSGIDRELQAFLISANAATLVDLKIMGANYPSSYFESGFLNPENAWTCVGLETLHLRSYHDEGAITPTVNGPGNQWLSRHIFIGLTGAFPKMKDLRVECPNIDFSLEGGMCLVRRMTNLERLRIASKRNAHFTERDLAWLIPDPTLEQRATNAAILENLQNQIWKFRGGSGVRPVEVRLAHGGRRRVRDRTIAGTLDHVADLLEGIQTKGGHTRHGLPYLESLIVEQGGKWEEQIHVPQQQRIREIVKNMHGAFFFYLTMEGAPPKLGVGP